jgi:hypothetical protein
MVEIEIGDWVNRPGAPAHLVESLIADRVVTRCGRQMRRQGAGGPLGRASEGRYHCFHCARLPAR